MDSRPILSQLTPNQQTWRIDWLGEIAYPGAVRQYRQPCIKVAISPLLGSPDHLAYVNSFQTEIQQQRNVWMPIGSLPMLRIGDIWQDGRLRETPIYSPSSFSLSISPETSTWVKAGLAIDGNYLLPFSEHPWHRLHTQTYCLTVEAEGVTLIIPGAELVRFYFGSSSTLLKRLVTSPLSEELLWRGKHYNTETRHLHLKLAEGLFGMSAADIGRIAADPVAWNAAASIYGNCVKATSQGEAAYLHTKFPFQGKTTVEVVGMWLPFGEKPKGSFLVFNFRSCSYPFPFRSLTYDAGDGYFQKRNAGTGGAGDVHERKRITRNAGSALEVGDPGARKSARRFDFGRSVQFPDLLHKSVWREKIVAKESKGFVIRHEDGSLETVAFGEPEGTGTATSVEGSLGQQDVETVEIDTQKLPYFVRIGIKLAMTLLVDHGSITAKLLRLVGVADPVFQLPTLVDDDGVVDPVTWYSEPDGSHRQRQACFVGLFQGAEKVKTVAVVEGDRVNVQPQVIDVPSIAVEQLLKRLAPQR
jgi:hypothetical protein